MSDEETKLPAGASVEIVLRRRRRDAPERAPAGPEEPPRSIVPTDDEPSRYVRRRRGIEDINFYDLGTRLRSVPAITGPIGQRVRPYLSPEPAWGPPGSVSEYVEIAMEAQGQVIEAQNPLAYLLQLSAAEHEMINSILLGALAPETPDEQDPKDVIDPTGFSPANGTPGLKTRLLPHSAQAWYQAAPDSSGQIRALGMPQLFYLVRPGEMAPGVAVHSGVRKRVYYDLPDQRFSQQGNTFLAQSSKWRRRDAAPEDARERWNANNAESGAAFAQIECRPKTFTAQNSGGLFVGSVGGTSPGEQFFPALFTADFFGGSYHGFSTADAELFKVTSLPSSASARVTYRAGGKVRVYLRPLLRAYTVQSEGVVHSSWIGRSRVYPGVTQTGQFSGPGNAQGLLREVAARSQYSNWATRDPLSEWLISGGRIDNAVAPGALVAIIVNDQKRYYVWANLRMAETLHYVVA